MASLDFDNEKLAFEKYYNTSLGQLQSAKETFLTLIRFYHRRDGLCWLGRHRPGQGPQGRD